MKKVWLVLLVLLLSIALLGCNPENNGSHVLEKTQQNEEQERQEVEALVNEFGHKLQMVSLLAPQEEVRQSIEDNYGSLVTTTLLTRWQANPKEAPGRLVSSPWPDRIEVISMEKTEDGYRVKGEIIEITSAEKVNGGAAARQPIDLVVIKADNRWLINDVILETLSEDTAIVYQNTQYGFNFTLPGSWKGYTIVNEEWQGLAIDGADQGKVVATGPKISIRHPQWTAQNPRQDIPILVLTVAQWNSLQKEEFSIGAAPIGPRELSRNSKYVFALPARYNFAFPTGYQEVETILEASPLQPIE